MNIPLCPPRRAHRRLLPLLPFLPLIVATGCATSTTDKGASQFQPVPKVAVNAEELTPVSPRSMTELLREADQELQKANLAQETSDHDAALRHYNRMLELLIEADLDPAIFYSLRSEFDKVLSNSTKHARLYELRQPIPHPRGTYSGPFNPIDIPNPLPDQVIEEIRRIQEGYPGNFQRALDRSHRYLPYVREALRQEGMPEEIAWLAIVESGFQPKIDSKADAGGMWQFLRGTARQYGMRVDKHVDERYNWHRSTQGAIDYLRDLYDAFGGSWPLALTAYIMGPGGLSNLIAQNGGERDYWTLITTPPASERIGVESKRYYSKFVASVIVGSNPERFGFSINPQPPDDSIRVPVKGMFALDDLDREMGNAPGTLARLNPDLIQEMTPPGEYAIAVPAGHTDRLLAAVKNAPAMRETGGTHKVRRGETVSQIAAKYGVSPTELMRANKISSARRLEVGQSLTIPGGGTARGGAAAAASSAPTKNAAATAPAPAEPAKKAPAKTYRVKRGDTLFDIAQAHGVSVAELQQWNNLGRRSRLQVGDTLRVSSGAAPAAAVASAKSAGGQDPVYHVVRKGEYPAKIAQQHGVTVEELLAWNKLKPSSMIRVGDRLVVGATGAPKAASASSERESDPEPAHTAAPAPAPAGAAKTRHTVAKGESPSVIASKHGVPLKEFLAWNGLNTSSVLHVGQELVVYSANGNGNGAAAAPSPAPKLEESTPASEPGKRLTHTVARGQNPTTIARQHGVKVSDLFRWNGWPSGHMLQVGDLVVLFKP